MRLIDAEEVIKAIDRHTFDTVDGLCLDEDITIILEEVPTAQPEIIRCKDCIHFQKVECVGGHYDGCDEWIDSDGYEMPVSEDEFCSRAERIAEKEEVTV